VANRRVIENKPVLYGSQSDLKNHWTTEKLKFKTSLISNCYLTFTMVIVNHSNYGKKIKSLHADEIKLHTVT